MYYLLFITGLALLISFFVNREKTFRAVKIAFKKFINISPAFLTMLIIVSIVLFLVPDKIISNYLGNNNKFIGLILASFFCSITFLHCETHPFCNPKMSSQYQKWLTPYLLIRKSIS